MSKFTNRYRIKRDGSGLFNADIKYWWCPFWINLSYFGTVERAEIYIRHHRQPVVKYL